jgi:hypothetical protein
MMTNTGSGAICREPANTISAHGWFDRRIDISQYIYQRLGVMEDDRFQKVGAAARIEEEL